MMQLTCASQDQAQSGKSVDANKIIKALSKGQNVLYQDAEISGKLDFTELESYPVGANLLFSDVEGSVTFVNCTFTDEVLAYKSDGKNQFSVRFFKNLTFLNCKFMKALNLRNAHIDGPLVMTKSYFQESTGMEGLTVRSECYMDQTVFANDLKMQTSLFQKGANFMNANLGGQFILQGSAFKADAQFGVCEFHGYADFTKVSFEQGAYFNYAKFFDRAYFNTSMFKGRADLMYLKFDKDCGFKNIIFSGPTRFNESTFESAVTFDGTHFVAGKPEMDKVNYKMEEKASFQNTTFSKLENLQ